MRKPLERRIYELARKHCGRQDQWRVSVDVLHRKSGSASPRRVFRAMLREMIEADALPDYHLEEEPGDILRVTPRDAVIEAAGRPMLASATYEVAREIAPAGMSTRWRPNGAPGGSRRAARASIPRQGVSGLASARICPDWPRCPTATPMMPCSRQPPLRPNGAMPRPITF
jgi:plasmid replication initiation protein